jgi:hypothetical protein
MHIRKKAGLIFGREPSNDYFIKILFLLIKCFQKRRFLWEFPIGSYAKLSSAVVAILVKALKWEIHIQIFSSETTGPIATKLWWNGPWVAPFQNCVR